MTRHLVFLLTAFTTSSFAIAYDASLPPKSPKAQVTQPPAPTATGEYGDTKFDAKKAIAISTATAASTDGDVIIKTTVAEVCPKKGCWMRVQSEKANEQIRVAFKDYGFFVPTELVGKEVAMRGRYVKHTESVEEQKHLLQDAKRPQAEIDAVTKPKETLRFIATGVKDLSLKPANKK